MQASAVARCCSHIEHLWTIVRLTLAAARWPAVQMSTQAMRLLRSVACTSGSRGWCDFLCAGREGSLPGVIGFGVARLVEVGDGHQHGNRFAVLLRPQSRPQPRCAAV